MREMINMEFTGERYVPALSGQIKYEHLHRYALSLEFAAGKTVLDIASGEGYGAALLAQAARSVTGVDIDPRSVAHARHIYYRPNLNFMVGSCEAIPLPDDAVDLVTCFETIEHHDKHEEMMLEIKRVLKPGGKLLISSPNRLTYSDEPGYANPFHIKELYYDELRELLGQHFKHVRIYGQRIAAGSFVYPLEDSSAEALSTFTGDGKGIAREVSNLSAPIYFIALCSDDAAVEEDKVSSIYLDSRDDLLKNIDGERLEHIRQLELQLQERQEAFGEASSVYEAQVSRQAEELLQARAGYEAQINLITEELSQARTGYETQISSMTEELSQAQTEIARQADELARLRAVQEKQTRAESQISLMTEELSQVRAGYEAQISSMTEELSKVRAGYESQISSMMEELSQAQTRITQQGDELARLRAVQKQLTHAEAQISLLMKELSHVRAGYEAQTSLLTEELSQARTGYETQISSMTEELSQAQTEIARQADELARLQAVQEKQTREQSEQLSNLRHQSSRLRQQLSRSEEQLSRLRDKLARSQEQSSRAEEELRRNQEELSRAQKEILREQEESSGARMQLIATATQLQEREEVLRHIYSSRSWQLASRLRRLRQRAFQAQELQHKLLRRINFLGEPLFRGALDVPVKGSRIGKYLEIAGWVLSGAAPIERVEAALDGMPLGMLSYGMERPDIAEVYPSNAVQACGYAGRFNLDGFSNGHSILVVRVWDEQGNQHLFTRSIMIDVPLTSPAEMIAPPDLNQVTTPAQLIAVAEKPAAPEVMDNELYRQLEKFITRFQTERRYDPSILNWDVDPNLSAAFPHLALFSPPASGSKSGLPYIDRSIDVVLLASQEARDLAEARRVATAAVINVKSLTSDESDGLSLDADRPRIALDVVWQENKDDQASSTKVSIIVPVYNKVSYTENCLAQLIKTLPDNFAGEIIVVDDASTDDTPAALSRWAERDRRIKVLRNSRNQGFIKTCNRGAEAATGEILIFLNNDTLPQPGWLQPLLRVLDDHADAGAVGGKLIYPDGTLQEAGGVIFSDGSGCNFGRNDSASHAPLYSFLREVDYCSGALLATRRSLFMENGGFDTRFAPAYYEDSDYCFSLREKGYKVYYQPESVIIHFEGVSSGTDINSGVKSYEAVNRAKFVAKWKHVLRRRPAAPERYDFATLQALAVRDRFVTEKSNGN